jgi:hypothetical protein
MQNPLYLAVGEIFSGDSFHLFGSCQMDGGLSSLFGSLIPKSKSFKAPKNKIKMYLEESLDNDFEAQVHGERDVAPDSSVHQSRV